MKNLLIILIILIAPTSAKASVIVNVSSGKYEIDTVYGNALDGYSVLTQMDWWGNTGLANELATAVGLQLGYTNNGFADVAKPLFAYFNHYNTRRIYSKQYSIDILGDETVNSPALDLGANGYYAVGSQVVPIPPALWLFGSGLLGLVGMARRKKYEV